MLYFSSSRCSLGEHKRLFKNIKKILQRQNFWTVVYIQSCENKVEQHSTFDVQLTSKEPLSKHHTYCFLPLAISCFYAFCKGSLNIHFSHKRSAKTNGGFHGKINWTHYKSLELFSLLLHCIYSGQARHKSVIAYWLQIITSV